MILSIAYSLFLTLFLELPIYFIGKRNSYLYLLIITLMNLITNVLMNVLYIYLHYNFTFILIYELITFIVEGIVVSFLLKNVAIGLYLSFFANGSSFLIGQLINQYFITYNNIGYFITILGILLFIELTILFYFAINNKRKTQKNL